MKIANIIFYIYIIILVSSICFICNISRHFNIILHLFEAVRANQWLSAVHYLGILVASSAIPQSKKLHLSNKLKSRLFVSRARKGS